MNYEKGHQTGSQWRGDMSACLFGASGNEGMYHDVSKAFRSRVSVAMATFGSEQGEIHGA